MPSPDKAMAHVFTAEEQAIVSFYENLVIVGTPAQVLARIEALVGRTGADEVMVVTHAHDVAARVRSYELVAHAFGLS
jgi:alkanesulfonate monooxygenase SsuD/methylene tetrahydromethanopterin reductase-like flavin-dependent oxidoreductase (luciferase family)